jgi:DNA polymerase-1
MLNMISFSDDAQPDIAILVPQRNFNKAFIEQHYVKKLTLAGIHKSRIVAYNLRYESTGKAPVGRCIRPWLEQLGTIFSKQGITTVLCADGPYFKVLAGVSKVEPHLGYSMASITWDGINAFYVPNANILFRHPEAQKKIDLALDAFVAFMQGKGAYFADSPIKYAKYLETTDDIYRWFNPNTGKIYRHQILSCDIETSGLAIGSHILSIAFGIDEHSGVVVNLNDTWAKRYIYRYLNHTNQKFIWHNGTFDVKHIIYNLWMQRDMSNHTQLLKGLHKMFEPGRYHDTKALSYLATNSCSGNDLSLKAQAFEFAGNYALEEVSDLGTFCTQEIMEYNLMDVLATWYVFKKHRKTVKEIQESTYQDLFIPSLKTITQMELIGLPLNMGTVLAANYHLQIHEDHLLTEISNDPIVQKFNHHLCVVQAEKDNKTLKKIIRKPEDLKDKIFFNPGSPKQLQQLLHDYYNLEVFQRTDTKQPSTNAKTLKAHIKHCEKNGQKALAKLLGKIIQWSEVTKITSTFIRAFMEKSEERDGWYYLLGNFNMGGTKSGRQSSSDPNLQNIPSTGTLYAKDIKKCVQAPPGFVFVGADYFSLEDRIGSLLSKDPNKLAVYTDGYDGHSLRAQAYFPDLMPDVTQEFLEAQTDAQRVSVINSIATRYPELRQLSKGPTFALTYLGTWKTLVQNFGLTEEEAKKIEANYHNLYEVADQWAADQIEQAAKQGYVELAFGLRLRTPMLTQVVWEDPSSWPYEVHKEKKTATNALGQSYGLLNTHTQNLFMQRVWASEYAEDIFPCAGIHDAQYYLIRNDLRTLKWVNDNLIECMEWNELPELYHPTVKLGAELEIFYPDWSNPIPVPNKASYAEIRQAIKEVL